MPSVAGLTSIWLPLLALVAEALLVHESLDLQSPSQGPKQVVVVCNGYSDARPVRIGEKLQVAEADDVRRLLSSEKDDVAAFSQEGVRLPSSQDGNNSSKAVRHQNRMRGAAQVRGHARRQVQRFGRRVTEGLLWTRSLDYGACEEYYIDFDKRFLVFVTPDQQNSCEFKVRLSETEGRQEGPREVKQRFAAVLSRPIASSPECAVESQEVPLPMLRTTANSLVDARAVALERMVAEPALPPGEVPTTPAELVLLDAYTHQDVTAEERQHGLTVHSQLDDEAVLRLEDEIEPTSITAEAVSSRLLSMDNTYSVEARRVHMVLQDLDGIHVYDRRDNEFLPGRTYVGVRLGVAGDSAFPQHLRFYLCEHMVVGEVPPPA